MNTHQGHHLRGRFRLAATNLKRPYPKVSPFQVALETPIHEHKWEKQPDLCFYERAKAAFWITLMCTTCGRLDGYHLSRKSVPKVLRAEALVVREF